MLSYYIPTFRNKIDKIKRFVDKPIQRLEKQMRRTVENAHLAARTLNYTLHKTKAKFFKQGEIAL
jgi:hypothetical protein